MLKSIDIKGLAVVDQLNLELNQGMTVLSGETGAGKSILLTAMKLCLGDRADASLLRPGAEKADISLDFDITHMPLVESWLKQHEVDDENECLIRRIINSDGRSRAFINGQAVNLKSLQKLSAYLISIHGQHDHLDLLQAAKQCQLLDDYQPTQTLLINCRNSYELWKKTYDELQSLTDGNDDNDGEKQLLKYQISELEQTDLIDQDYDELVAEHHLLSNMGKVIELAESQINTLYEQDNGSIHDQLSRSSHSLDELSELSPKFSVAAEQIKEALILIQESSRDLKQQVEHQADDPERLDLLDKKLSKTHELARKLKIEPPQLVEKYNELHSRLQLLENRDERLDALQLEIQQAEKTYQETAKALHQQRKNTAEKLSQEITKTLKTLGLPDGQLEIRVLYTAHEKPQKNGFDDVSFMITTNPGMPPSPLSKVASGGELSRISLSIQVVTSRSNTTPTLVFDEVDAGIGGGVAETVGLCLRKIATDRQVLCVTHLPQVASQGHHHLFVSKNKEHEQTKTQIHSLNQTERIDEVARMLGGVEMSDKTLAHAQEMLEKTSVNR
ncbi:MAG: DNA repair protein RecN [Cycloclasticus sp.]